MQIFQARSVQADSTIMPQVFSWIDGTIDESPGCNSSDDHCIVLLFNLPSMGVISVAKWDYLVTMVANALNRYKRNSLALVIHPNRASQKSRTLVHPWFSQTTRCWKPTVLKNNILFHTLPKPGRWPSPKQNRFCQNNRWQEWHQDRPWHEGRGKDKERWWRGRPRCRRRWGMWRSVPTWESCLHHLAPEVWKPSRVSVVVWLPVLADHSSCIAIPFCIFLSFFPTVFQMMISAHRKALGLKERGLRVRPITWVFDPVSWPKRKVLLRSSNADRIPISPVILM